MSFPLSLETVVRSADGVVREGPDEGLLRLGGAHRHAVLAHPRRVSVRLGVSTRKFFGVRASSRHHRSPWALPVCVPRGPPSASAQTSNVEEAWSPCCQAAPGSSENGLPPVKQTGSEEPVPQVNAERRGQQAAASCVLCELTQGLVNGRAPPAVLRFAATANRKRSSVRLQPCQLRTPRLVRNVLFVSTKEADGVFRGDSLVSCVITVAGKRNDG